MRDSLLFISVVLLSYLNLIAQSKTLTATVVNENGTPWNNQYAQLYEITDTGDLLLGEDEIENGQLLIENIVTGITESQPLTPIFYLYQNYPNPFNPSTKINFSIDKTQNVTLKIYDILGREIKTLVKNELEAGSYSVEWNGDNNNGNGVSGGVYIYVLSGERFLLTNKMIMLDGNKSVKKSFLNKIEKIGNPKIGRMKQTNDTPYKLVIYGEDVMTTNVYNIELWGQTQINLGIITANAKPILTSTAEGVYDIDTKYDENGNRQTPTKLEGLKVYLLSSPENFVLTDEDGQFSLNVDKLGEDEVYVVDETNTYYNWHNPRLEIELGTNEITAFNDNTGIPLFKKFTDENGEDLLDFMVRMTWAEFYFPDDEVWKGSVPRIRDEDLPVKIYMNRPEQTTEYYADKVWEGFLPSEGKRFKIIEETKPENATIKCRYDGVSLGRTNFEEIEYDEFGPYLKLAEIIFQGPPSVINPPIAEKVPYVGIHEMYHIIKCSGELSEFVNDVSYPSPTERRADGQPVELSQKESKLRTIIYSLERNFKPLDYFK